jgi:hypothetical protein
MDDDFNQTLIYSTDNPTFNIINNQLILKTPLNYDHRQSIPLIIRATDNGQPPEFVCLFIFDRYLKIRKGFFRQKNYFPSISLLLIDHRLMSHQLL